MPDKKLVDLRRLAGEDYIVLPRKEYEEAKQQLQDIVKDVEVVYRKKTEASK